MKSIYKIIKISFILLFSLSKINNVVAQELHSVNVIGSEVKISFPIGDGSEHSNYFWNMPTLENNSIEYKYSAKVNSDSSKYEFGYFLYKYPNAKPDSGNFAKLIKSGQLSLFREFNDKGSMITEGRFITKIEKDKFTITIKDSETLKKVFASKPKVIELEIRTPRSNVEKKIIPVEYIK